MARRSKREREAAQILENDLLGEAFDELQQEYFVQFTKALPPDELVRLNSKMVTLGEIRRKLIRMARAELKDEHASATD